MKNLIITASGSDRSGIVSEISGVITTHGGNVEESRMSRMGSEFAIIMLISISIDMEESLLVALQSIKGLTISTQYTDVKDVSDANKYQIDLIGADNEGIVKVLSEYLAKKSINIIELDTHITYAPISGTPLFNLKAIILLPENKNSEKIHTDLTHISQKLGVKITLNKSESIIELV